MTPNEHHHHDAHGTNAEQWEARYSGDHIWSGNPNALLVEHVGALTPGAALELGCGEGADAIWLAQQGWTVLATDIAQSALDKATEHGRDAGVEGFITWGRHDLEQDFPEGQFNLVTASYLHSWHQDFHREPVLRRAAAAVAPGGRLLVISHAGAPSFADPDVPRPSLPSAAETVAFLELGPGWEIEVSSEVDVAMESPDGDPATRPDSVVLARRTA